VIRPGPRRSARAGCWLLAFAIALASATGCRKRKSPDELALEARPVPTTLPPLALNDDTPDLQITWVDKRGDAHVANKPADVPTEGRDQVRVVVTTREEGTGELFYVANLTVKNPDGNYAVTHVPRVEWDAMIVKRRRAFAAANAPANEEPAGSGDDADADAAAPINFTVVVYGASWCGACHEAMAYLKRHRVPAVEKDIEKDPAADAEMRAKLARAGVHAGSIPVIDVKGKILIGFEAHALEAAVRGASAVAL
jgi:glutaredoxin